MEKWEVTEGKEDFPAILRGSDFTLGDWLKSASHNAVSRDLLKSYERGLYERCALHAGNPLWGGMIAEQRP